MTGKIFEIPLPNMFPIIAYYVRDIPFPQKRQNLYQLILFYQFYGFVGI